MAGRNETSQVTIDGRMKHILLILGAALTIVGTGASSAAWVASAISASESRQDTKIEGLRNEVRSTNERLDRIIENGIKIRP